MPTTLDESHVFDTQAFTQAQWEAMFDQVLLPGVLRGEDNKLAVTVSASPLAVLVDTGKLTILGHYAENTSQKSLTIAAPDDTYSRVDRVIGYVEHGRDEMGVDVITGTPAAVPLLPDLERSVFRYEIPLAQVTVAPGASILVAGNLVDVRQWAVPAHGGGGVISVNTVAADTTTTVSTGGEVLVPGWAFPVTVRAGRRYRLRLLFYISNLDTTGGSSGTTLTVRWRDGGLTGTLLHQTMSPTGNSLPGYVVMNRLLDNLDEGVHTVVLTSQFTGTAWTIVGSTNASAANSVHPVPQFTVEDCGPLAVP